MTAAAVIVCEGGSLVLFHIDGIQITAQGNSVAIQGRLKHKCYDVVCDVLQLKVCCVI